jgi:hypothetical protein
MSLSKALNKLGFRSRIDFRLEDNGDGKGIVIIWLSDKAQPSDAEIKTATDAWQAEYDAQEYARKRKEEYPTIEECVHAILDDDLENLQILRQAVKDKFPKENS